jgi:hypothetical protein
MKVIGDKGFKDILSYSVRAKLQELGFQELTNDDGNIVSWRRGFTTDYRGNIYNSYPTAVNAINEKYNAIDEWGVVLTGNIIDVRSAFTVPAGLEVIPTTKDEDIQPELDFANEFLDFNGLDDEIPFEFAKEAEIEGKLCVQSFWEPDFIWNDSKRKAQTGMVKIRFLPWTTTHYNVITTTDYMDFEKITYKIEGQAKPVVIEKPDFTYRRFGGRIDRPNEPAMKIWKCLTQIDFLDMALRDWREIDRLFASPTPYFKTNTELEAKRLMAELDKMNWKIKKLLAGTAEFKFVGPDISGIQNLLNEITTLAKIISGTTGVPVHFLGLPDLLSNRATANNLMELVWASTVKERETWNSAYTEILRKAIDKWNENLDGKTQLRNDVLRVEIQEVSSEQWVHLEKVFIPLLLAGKVSLEYVLSQIPNLDSQEELDRQENMENEELERTKAELDTKILENEMLTKNNINNEGGDDG